MANENVSSMPETLHPFEVQVLECEAIESHAEELKALFNNLRSYSETCAQKSVERKNGTNVSFEALSRMREEALQLVTEAIKTLDQIDAEIANSVPMNRTVFTNPKNSAVQNLRLSFQFIQQSLSPKGQNIDQSILNKHDIAKLNLEELPSLYPSIGNIEEMAKDFSYVRGDAERGLGVVYSDSKSGERNSIDIQGEFLGKIKVIIEKNSKVIEQAGTAVRDFYDVLGKFRTLAIKARTAELEPKIKEAVAMVSEWKKSTNTGTQIVSDPMKYLLEHGVQQEIANQGSSEFWSQEEIDQTVDKYCRDAAKRISGIKNGSVWQEIQTERNERASQLQEGTVDVKGNTNKSSTGFMAKLRKLLGNM